MGAGQITRLNVTAGHLPQGYQLSTYDNLLQDFAARLIVTPNQAYSTFFYGPTAPLTDQGPWFNTLLNEWWVWDTNIGAYRVESSSSVRGEMEVGAIVDWPGKIIDINTYWGPRFCHCDGRAISRSDYTTLYAICGDQYGNGDGTTTFNIPDLKDRFRVGAFSDDAGTAKTRVSDGSTLTKDRAYIQHVHHKGAASALGVGSGLAQETSGAGFITAEPILNDAGQVTPVRVLPPYISLTPVIRIQ